MKYNYKDYEPILADDMKLVEIAYKKYKLDEDNEDLYYKLKEAIFNFSMSVKSARSCHYLSNEELDEMMKYFWELLL